MNIGNIGRQFNVFKGRNARRAEAKRFINTPYEPTGPQARWVQPHQKFSWEIESQNQPKPAQAKGRSNYFGNPREDNNGGHGYPNSWL